MFRIRKIEDDIAPAIRQVVEIMRRQFPRITQADLDKLPQQLHDPFRYQYRSMLFVAEDQYAHARGFALLLHMTDLGICYLDLLSVAPARAGDGVGTALYERAREEAEWLKVLGLFYECKVDEPALVADPAELKENQVRMRFYGRYGARPIINNDYTTPVHAGDTNLYYLVFDGLGRPVLLPRTRMRRIAAAILERKYGELFTREHIARIAGSFRDDPAPLRAPRYLRRRAPPRAATPQAGRKAIALVVNTGHAIHHVRERGYSGGAGAAVVDPARARQDPAVQAPAAAHVPGAVHYRGARQGLRGLPVPRLHRHGGERDRLSRGVPDPQRLAAAEGSAAACRLLLHRSVHAAQPERLSGRARRGPLHHDRG